MKKILLFILLSISSCIKENKTSTWIIHRVDGEIDTIEAKNYWIMTQDTLFIKFEIEENTYLIYNKENIIKYDYRKR